MVKINVELTIKQSAILIAVLRRDNDLMTVAIRDVFNGPEHSADAANLYSDIENNNEIIRLLEEGAR